MDPSDMQAFARAQQLLSRKEDLDELPPMAPLSSMQEDGPSPKRRSTKQAAAPKPAAARRRPAPQKEFALPAHHGPLPTLSQLATESVGQELQFLQKPNPTTRRPLRPRAPPEESRRAALSAMDTAMPSLDDDSAQLIARARALIEDSGAGTEGLTQAPSRPGAASSASLQRRQRRPASSARLQTLPERTGPAAASAAGGGAAAAARIRTAPPQSAPAYEPVARYGGGNHQRAESARLGSATAHCPSLWALTSGAGSPGYWLLSAHSGRAAEPLPAPSGGLEACQQSRRKAKVGEFCSSPRQAIREMRPTRRCERWRGSACGRRGWRASSRRWRRRWRR